MHKRKQVIKLLDTNSEVQSSQCKNDWWSIGHLSVMILLLSFLVYTFANATIGAPMVYFTAIIYIIAALAVLVIFYYKSDYRSELLRKCDKHDYECRNTNVWFVLTYILYALLILGVVFFVIFLLMD